MNRNQSDISLKFTFRGRTETADEILRVAPKRAKVISDRLKRVELRDEAKQFLGFVVLGFSPDRLASARAEHKHYTEHRADIGRSTPEFSEEEFMRKARPRKLRGEPYETKSAAEQCAELARKAGWKGVSVQEILRG